MCVLIFEGHILNFNKNTSAAILHYFVSYDQVMIKRNGSFQIVWLGILHINYENP